MSAAHEVESSRFDGLSVAQQQRLSELLDECLACLERGEAIDRERLIARNPDLAGPIQVYLESLEFLQDAAAGFVPATLTVDTPADPDCAAPDCADPGCADPGFAEHAAGEKRLGDFRILAEIGRGGMGVVYEAWQVSLDRRVALKVLPFAALLDARQIARFRNEAQAAARLHHPNIVPVFAVGTERGVHYYAMQYIDGQPLDRVITAIRQSARSRGTGPSQAVDVAARGMAASYAADKQHYFRNVARLGAEAAAALHAAHDEGVVHRDIKPSNLLLDADGKLWVADFGLARCRADSNLTASGDLVGTMRYMSPEQSRGGSSIVDHRSDVYSLAATLYELLTLRPAVRGEDAAAIVRRLDRDEPYPPRQWDANIPVDLETIVLKAMSRSPDARYFTAHDLADDLRRFLAGQPIHARRPTLTDRWGKWIWRHKQAAWSTIFVMLTAILGLAIGTVLLARQSRQTARALTTAQENFQQYRRQLARTKNHLAMLQEQQGELSAAAASFREAARLQREILAEHPEDRATFRDLSATLNNLGFFLSHQDAPRAAAAYGESIDVLRQLVQLDPTNVPAQRDLALASSNLGTFYRRHGDPRRAVQRLQAACAMFDSLAASSQLDAHNDHDVAVSYNNLGMAQYDLEQLEAAEQSFLAALDAAERSTAEAALTAGQLSALGGIHSNLGLVREKQSRELAAAESFTRAIQYQQRALRQAPRVDRYRELLNQHYAHGGRIMRQIGNFRQAAQWVAARQALRPRDADTSS